MSYDTESDLKYIESLSNIPVTGEGFDSTWSTSKKLDAAEDGESKLEADVNDGQVINSPESIHGYAAATWATYRLVLGMKTPDSATRGDSLDEGGERMSFADHLKSDYYEYVDSITRASGDESEDGPAVIGFEVADWQP